MSRFYDALKQASLLGQPETAASEADVPTSTTPDEKAPAEQPPAASRNSGYVTIPSAASDPWKLLPESELHPRIRTFRNGSFGSGAHTVLDAKQRLIPNASEPVIVEYYRRLRTKLVHQHANKAFRSVVVTSPNPQEGKTVTTLNLAMSFAMLPAFRVAVVDGDLRRASLGKWAGATDRPGLSDLIEGTVTLQDTIVKYDEIPIHIVPSGLSKKPAAELLHSRELRTVFGMMAEHFDLILVDSPPVNLITDALLLASGCDAVMLVARAFSTTRKDLERAAHELQTFRVIGTVLNGGTRGHLYRRYGGYY